MEAEYDDGGVDDEDGGVDDGDIISDDRAVGVVEMLLQLRL